jgi:hypothetical protein
MVITQHIPEARVGLFARRMDVSRHDCGEAKRWTADLQAAAYIAPGNAICCGTRCTLYVSAARRPAGQSSPTLQTSCALSPNTLGTMPLASCSPAWGGWGIRSERDDDVGATTLVRRENKRSMGMPARRSNWEGRMPSPWRHCPYYPQTDRTLKRSRRLLTAGGIAPRTIGRNSTSTAQRTMLCCWLFSKRIGGRLW